ncbi:MAG: hypothetical protein P1U78_11995 [Alcanivoracaceae bacterium]|nr:hypothetical protein [Alcanivoracaceae bacterium]
MPKDHLTMPRAILRVLSCSADHFGIGQQDAQEILNHWKEQFVA